MGLTVGPLEVEAENQQYGGALTTIAGVPVRLRVAKITPVKVGAFVTVWRASAPLPAEDRAELLLVAVHDGDRSGFFAFPRAALVQHGILSVKGVGGKRGFRVYPPWVVAPNAQARRTQRWQGDFFVELVDGATELARRMIVVAR